MLVQGRPSVSDMQGKGRGDFPAAPTTGSANMLSHASATASHRSTMNSLLHKVRHGPDNSPAGMRSVGGCSRSRSAIRRRTKVLGGGGGGDGDEDDVDIVAADSDMGIRRQFLLKGQSSKGKGKNPQRGGPSAVQSRTSRGSALASSGYHAGGGSSLHRSSSASPSSASSSVSAAAAALKRSVGTQAERADRWRRDVEAAGQEWDSFLPDEIMILIFGACHPADMCKLARVCRAFSVLGNEGAVWRSALSRYLISQVVMIHHNTNQTGGGGGGRFARSRASLVAGFDGDDYEDASDAAERSQSVLSVVLESCEENMRSRPWLLSTSNGGSMPRGSTHPSRMAIAARQTGGSDTGASSSAASPGSAGGEDGGGASTVSAAAPSSGSSETGSTAGGGGGSTLGLTPVACRTILKQLTAAWGVSSAKAWRRSLWRGLCLPAMDSYVRFTVQRQMEETERVVSSFFREYKRWDHTHADLRATLDALEERLSKVQVNRSTSIRKLNEALRASKMQCMVRLTGFEKSASKARDCFDMLDQSVVRDTAERVAHVEYQVRVFLAQAPSTVATAQQGRQHRSDAPSVGEQKAVGLQRENTPFSADGSDAAAEADGADETDSVRSGATSSSTTTGSISFEGAAAAQEATLKAVKVVKQGLLRVAEMGKAYRLLNLSYAQRHSYATAKLDELETLITMWARDEKTGAGHALSDAVPAPERETLQSDKPEDEPQEQPEDPNFRF